MTRPRSPYCSGCKWCQFLGGIKANCNRIWHEDARKRAIEGIKLRKALDLASENLQDKET